MTGPISFETIDDLEILWDSLVDMSRSIRRPKLEAFPLIVEKLSRLDVVLEDALCCVEQALETLKSAVKPAGQHRPENQRILEFDALMCKLTDQIKHECAKAQQPLDDRVANLTDPIGDFEIDVQINYLAHEHTIGHSEDADNCLTSRNYSMRIRRPEDVEILDGEWQIPNGSEIDNWPRGCWLFHDLVDHSYGAKNPRLALRQIDAIGAIWVEVVVRQQYCLNTRTGQWE